MLLRRIMRGDWVHFIGKAGGIALLRLLAQGSGGTGAVFGVFVI